MSLSVIIPSKTDANVVPCMEAVRRHESSARIIVIDDGLTLDWLPRPDLGPAIGYRASKPFVYARNCNAGIHLAEEDDVMLLNDDALLDTPGGFTAMQACAKEHPEYGVISAVTNVAGNPDQHPQGEGLRDAGRKTVAFVCVLIPRRTIHQVGVLDERFTAYGWEDNDYCRRVREAGLKVGIFDGCYVDHGSLRSTFRGDPLTLASLNPGAEIYRAKWGSLD